MLRIEKIPYSNDTELKVGDVVVAVVDVDDRFPTKGKIGVVVQEDSLLEYPRVLFKGEDFGVFDPEEDGVDCGCINVEYFKVVKLVEVEE